MNTVHSKESLKSLSRSALVALASQIKIKPKDGRNIGNTKSDDLIEAIMADQAKQSDGNTTTEPSSSDASAGCDGVASFKINRRVFSRQLAAATPVCASSNGALPILDCMLISFGNGNVSVGAFNLDTAVETVAPAETSGEHKIAVPHRVLAAFIKRCSSEYLNVEIRRRGLMLIHDLDNKTEINCLPADEYPAIPIPPEGRVMSINGAVLRRGITAAAVCASSDPTRYVLRAVFFEIGEALNLVATDGRRIAVIDVKPTAIEPGRGKSQHLVGSDAIDILCTSIPVSDVVMFANERTVAFVSSDAGFKYSFCARVVEGNFPNYRFVIPKDTGVRFRIRGAEVLAALGRLMVLCSKEGTSVKFDFRNKGTVRLDVMNAGVGIGNESIKILDGDEPSERCYLGLNPNYINEILIAWKDVADVDFIVRDEVSPLTIHAPGMLAVVMPIRLA